MLEGKEPPILKLVGENIRKMRVVKRYSQEELSLEADIPKNQVGRIERGEINTTLLTLQKISIALGVSIKDIVDV